METVCLVACTSRKALYPAPAEFLYRSPLFAAARAYAESRCDRWFILSAKHGLIEPGKEVAPYDESLHRMTDAERERWAHGVFGQLSTKLGSNSRVVFLAGAAYRAHLERLLHGVGMETSAPLSNLGIGGQVAWLQRVQRERPRLRDIDRLYSLLHRLEAAGIGPMCALSGLSAKSVQPVAGVYFFFEPGEMRMTSSFEGRITRIGTHSVSQGSRATLWNRLRTHRGGGDGMGNHRGSIFRLHVGEALIRRAGLEPVFTSWGVGQSASSEVRTGEVEIELEVSSVIGEMRVLWVAVGDDASADSDRSYIERNLIALLAGPRGPIDLASSNWLGQWSTRGAVRASGLWNVNHVGETYDPRALDILERYVEASEGKRQAPRRSIAPRGWRKKLRASHSISQLELLEGADIGQ